MDLIIVTNFDYRPFVTIFVFHYWFFDSIDRRFIIQMIKEMRTCQYNQVLLVNLFSYLPCANEIKYYFIIYIELY